MRNLYALGALLLIATGCPNRVVLRDAAVYKAELNQYDKWATEQARYLREFIEEHCTCESDAEGPQFNEVACEEAATYVLLVEYRHQWHKDMSLYNAGLIEREPAALPPDVPSPSCPLPPTPDDAEED